MAKEIDVDRLVHYFAGECTPEEKAEIEAWIARDPTHERYVAALRQIWEAASTAPRRRNVDRMWNALSRRLPASNPSPSSLSSPTRRSQNRTPRSGSSAKRRAIWRQPVRGMALAAIVVLVAVIAGLIVQEMRLTAPPSMREVVTGPGQRARVELGDGTHVVLNADSKLELPTQFAEDKRIVGLRGEAYFEVAPDEDRPFRVRAAGTITQVLGTKFNVGAYPEDTGVEVVVAEGKVAVRPEGGSEDQNVLLERRQFARLVQGEERVVRREVNVDTYLAWMDGRLVFQDAPIQEVVRKLRRWYDLEVELAPALADVDRLNASFEEESIEQVLNIICETLNLHYERNGRHVTFLPATMR